MPGTVETKIKVGMDVRDVKKGGQEIKNAFNPRAIQDFRTATRDLERQYTTLIRKQADLTKQLGGIDKGTKAFKAMKEELKGVADQSKLVERSLSQLDRIQTRAARQQKFGRGRNFAAGLVQGSGLGQYIPTEPGMGARIAGTMVAGGVRRAAGGAAAPFLTPGVGGFAQGLSAIPGLGGFAAGALQTAAAGYQSAAGMDAAQLASLFQAGGQAGKAKPVTQGQKDAVAAAQAARTAAGNALQTAITGQGPRAQGGGPVAIPMFGVPGQVPVVQTQQQKAARGQKFDVAAATEAEKKAVRALEDAKRAARPGTARP